MGLECYVDADFAGGCNCETTDNANNFMSQTGFVIMYANCPNTGQVDCKQKLL